MPSPWTTSARGVAWRYLDNGSLQLGPGPRGGDWYEDLRGELLDSGRGRKCLAYINVSPEHAPAVLRAIGSEEVR